MLTNSGASLLLICLISAALVVPSWYLSFSSTSQVTSYYPEPPYASHPQTRIPSAQYSAVPVLSISINSTSGYPVFQVHAGENLTILLDFTSAQRVNLNLTIRQVILPSDVCTPSPQTPGCRNTIDRAIQARLALASLAAPMTGLVAHIDIDSNATPGIHPMVIDAKELGVTPSTTFGAGFELEVLG
jgi:hypothetical protein